MSVFISVYGKGGIGNSTTSSNLSVAMATLGAKVLQIGCDPKHDSTFTIAGELVPTVIDVLQDVNYHMEEITADDVIRHGYMGVDVLETGGPPAGAGCGGYVVGETTKLLNELDLYDAYDVVLFDVLGDVVCGGFAAPLQKSEYACIVTTNDFDSLFAANRICAAIDFKSRRHEVRLAGVIANRIVELDSGQPFNGQAGTDLIDTFCERVGATIIGRIPQHDAVRRSRIAGQTLFEFGEGIVQPYLDLADYLLNEPPKYTPKPMTDREVFSVISGWRGEEAPRRRTAPMGERIPLTMAASGE